MGELVENCKMVNAMSSSGVFIKNINSRRKV